MIKNIDKEYNKINDFVCEEGLKDLKTSLLKKHMKSKSIRPQENSEIKVECDIILTIVKRYTDDKVVPIGLGLLSSYIEQYGYTSKLLDIYSYNLVNTFDKEIAESKAKIIGFYCSSDNEVLIRNTIKHLKNKYNITTFVGGPQAVCLDESFLRETGCDIVTEGEGEEALKELLDYYIKNKGDLKDIKNIKYIDQNNLFHQNEMRPPIQDLDSLPFPKLYYDDHSHNKSVAHLITGRGCPYRCSFCYEGANSRVVRYRSIENVFDEIEHIIRQRPETSYLEIIDDTFTLDYNRVLEFCSKMKKFKQHHDLSWFCEAHVSTLCKNPDMAQIMVDAGLNSVQIGIESGSQKVLDAYNKKTTPEMIHNVVKIFREAKLQTLTGNIIIGGAWESPETIAESTKMAKSLIHEGLGMIELFSVYLWPFPETPISRCPEKYGINIQKDQLEKSIITFCNCVNSSYKLSREEIIEARKNFDNAIKEEYKKCCLELDKNQLAKFWSLQKDGLTNKSNWSKYAYSFEHVRKYFATISNTNYIYDSKVDFKNIYPIRTFELLEYVDKNLYVSGVIFESTKMKILENSNGRNTMAQIAEKIDVDVDTVIKVCSELENKCFIYYSHF